MSADAPDQAERSPSPESSRRMRSLQFSLRSLLLLAALIALLLALWKTERERRILRALVDVHGLKVDATDLAADKFRVRFEDIVQGNDLLVKRVVLETIGHPAVTVTDKQGNMSSADARRSGGPPDRQLVRSTVTVVADMVVAANPKQNLLRTSLQVSIADNGRAGGPGTHPIPDTTRMEDAFQMLLAPREYPRGTEIELCTVAGRRIYLIVK
jgi:hypothetical protein